jgi:hypothetical protein
VATSTRRNFFSLLVLLADQAILFSPGYFLIFLNSALMLYVIRKHFAHSPISQEKVLYAFFFVLGAADCE